MTMTKQVRNTLFATVGAFALGFLVGLFVPTPGVLPVNDVTSFEQLSEDQVDKLSKVLIDGGAVLPKTDDPESETCCWPRMCEGLSAYESLMEIRTWVLEAEITEELKAELLNQVVRCLDPNLKTASGVHVCDITDSDPCQQLQEQIFEQAAVANGSQDPEAAWTSVKDEFEQFPSGN